MKLRFRVRQINKQFVVWDFLRDKQVTIPFSSRTEAVRFSRKFIGYLDPEQDIKEIRNGIGHHRASHDGPCEDGCYYET